MGARQEDLKLAIDARRGEDRGKASEADYVLTMWELWCMKYGEESVGPLDLYQMKPSGYWTEEKIQEEALKYSSRVEFEKGSAGAYKAALRLGLLDQVCAHMVAKLTAWTPEMLQKEALKYSSRYEFHTGSGGAYKAAVRLGILDQVCAHMVAKLTAWTPELIQKEALKYSSRGEFKKDSGGAYKAALRLGILDQVCAHMVAKKPK